MAACPSCNAEYAAGTRWCSICHTNVVNPKLGRLASPGKRLGAYVIDFLVPTLVVICISIGQIGGAVGELTGGGADDGVAGTILFLSIGLFVAYAVWSLILFARGETIGKKLLGMRVVKEDGGRASFFTMLIREWVGKSISALVLWLGFLWILFDKENQGWHDKLMSTYVVADFQGEDEEDPA